MYRIGNRFSTDCGDEYIVAAISRPKSRIKKIAIINIRTGMNAGRVVLVKDYYNIASKELERAFLGITTL